jgi:hypothetical protein
MDVPHIVINGDTGPAPFQDGTGEWITLTKPGMRKTDRFGGDVAKASPAK